MAKRSQPDPNQLTFDFSWQEKVDAYITSHQEVLDAVDTTPSVSSDFENEYEACVEIAAAVKQAVRPTGMSRDQIVDAINTYFGRNDEGAAADPPTCRKPLTIHMLNNYLSKPTEYPMPAYYLLAIIHITGSLAPLEAIASVEGARVISGSEIRAMNLGKLEQMQAEIQRVKRELKKS